MSSMKRPGMRSYLATERTVSRANAAASGAGGRKFKFCHPDQYLLRSALPGVAPAFCSPVLFRFGITSYLATGGSRNERWCAPGRGISHQQEEYRINERLISIQLTENTIYRVA